MFCGWCDPARWVPCTCGLPTTLCCVGILHCAALITWFVSIIIIGVDCKVHDIPCVPM
jgi:hypothetical protein